MSVLEEDLLCSNEAYCLRARGSHPKSSSCHPVWFRLSVSQLVNEILEKFQAVVNYMLFSKLDFVVLMDVFSLFSK